MENKTKRNRPLNQEKRESILKAAIDEFYDKGFEGSSMDTISKEATVSKATVYNHFTNKEELFFAIIEILKIRVEDSFKYKYKKDKTIEEQLYVIAKKEIDFLDFEENVKLLKIMIMVVNKKSEIGLKVLKTMKDGCLIMAESWFAEAKKEGKLDFESASFVSQQFIGMIKAFVFYPQFYGAPLLDKKEKEKVIEESIKMITVLYLKK